MVNFCQDARNYFSEFFERVALFIRVRMPVIGPFNAGDDVSKHQRVP